MTPAKDRTRWCVLRCAGRRTLGLAESLKAEGFEVWAPVKIKIETVPGMNAKRQVRLPILPELVFAREHHLRELLVLADYGVRAMLRKRVLSRRTGWNIGDAEEFQAGELRAIIAAKAHPEFTLFRSGGKLAFADDAALEPLRHAERRQSKPVWAQRAFKRGQRVRAANGSSGFDGSIGIVERSDTEITLVCFGGFFGKVEIPTSLLSEDEAYQLQSRTGIAAQAA